MNVFPQKIWNADFINLSTLFFPIMTHGGVFSKFNRWPTIHDLNNYKPKHVTSFLSQNISFVQQKSARRKNSFSSLYEPQIFLEGKVNTRENSWHDFFNALIWYTFPKTKSVLNMRQFIAYDEKCDFPWNMPQKSRTREQDYLTMFDEGGCICVTFSSSNNVTFPFLFGHGFYERILYGDTDLSACCIKINYKNNLNWNVLENRERILCEIDLQVAIILQDRSFYENQNAFTSISLSNFYNLLQNSFDLKNL